MLNLDDVRVPQTEPTPRLLLLFAARDGRREAVGNGLPALAKSIRDAVGAPTRAIGLLRVDPDPFAGAHPSMRGFDAGLDLRLEGGGSLDALIEATANLATEIGEHVQVDLSYALAGPIHVVIDDEAAATLRYVYAMRRRADWSEADYQRHYREQHVKFGLRTPGISGYSQHRLDGQASQRAAAIAGLGCWAASSVSELYIPDLDGFMREAMDSEVGAGAVADEQRFVDRANSVASLLRVTFDET